MTQYSTTLPAGTAEVPASETSSCPPTESLRQYLTGWLDEEQSSQIESHVQECGECERTLRELDLEPETLMQTCRGTVTIDNGPDSADAVSAESEDRGRDPVTDALDKVRQLMDPTDESARRTPGDKTESSSMQPIRRELGMYELQRSLGRGGMGAVYLATHRQLRKQVAIKLLPLMSSGDSDVRARFEREIRVIGRLNHPSIVTATDAGEIDGTQFLVMEYVSGMDLGRLARLLGRLPVPEACELMRQVALGLSCAHADGVVHRDIKPSNLMLDETGHIRILDFGLAQFCSWDEVSLELTTVGQLMGTLDYMAPEQAEQSGPVDYRADLYALGATLFRLLCGRPPLAASPCQSPLEKLRLLATQPAPRLITLCPEAPPELSSLVASLLARRPQDRPASAAHAAEQLAEFAAGADLPQLLKRAVGNEAMAADQEHSSGVTDNAGLRKRTNLRSGATSGVDSGGIQQSGRFPLWPAAVSLPLLILAGVFIRLELSKGQLIIESEADNVTVQILRDGKATKGLSIHQGTTATRLSADSYQITIDGPTDGLLIENNVFTLKNGETVIARILREERLPDTTLEGMTPEIAADSSGVSARKSGQPVYEGRSVDEWLDTLARERSPSELRLAFEACKALVMPETSGQITTVMLNLLPQMDGDMRLVGGQESNATLDREGGLLLWKANRGAAYYTIWTQEFEAGDESWRNRLWGYAAPDLRGVDSVETLQPFLTWAERRLNSLPAGDKHSDEHHLHTADRLRNFCALPSGPLASHDESVDRVAAILKNSPHLGMTWWLSYPLVSPQTTNDGVVSERNIWPTPISSEITRYAIKALEDADTSPALVAQACCILTHGAELDSVQRNTVLDSISRRLILAGSSPDSLTQIAEIDRDFWQFVTPRIRRNNPLTDMLLSVNLNGSRAVSGTKSCVILQLLNVVSRFDDADSLRPQLNQIVDPLQGTIERILAARTKSRSVPVSRARFPQQDRTPALIMWPDILDSPGVDSVPGDDVRRTMISRERSTFWGDHQPTVRDWLESLILMHPAMHNSVAEKMLELDADGPDTQTPVDETEPVASSAPGQD